MIFTGTVESSILGKSSVTSPEVASQWSVLASDLLTHHHLTFYSPAKQLGDTAVTVWLAWQKLLPDARLPP